MLKTFPEALLNCSSMSLGVRPNKKNRTETVKILGKMAPGIKIEADVSHGVYL